MPQLFPNPISSNSFVNVIAGSGLTGGGSVQLGGTVTLATSNSSSISTARNNYAVTPTPDGTISEFTIVGAAVPVPPYIDVYVNGLLQDSDTYIISGQTVSFQNSSGTLPPPSGALVYVVYSPNDLTRNQFALTAIGSSTTNFSIAANPFSSYIDIFVAGVWQDTTAYSLNYTSGTWEVVFGSAPGSSDIVAVFDPDNWSSRNVYGATPVTDGTTTTFTITGGTPTSLYVDTYVAGLFQYTPTTYYLNLAAGAWQLAFTTAPASASDLKVVF